MSEPSEEDDIKHQFGEQLLDSYMKVLADPSVFVDNQPCKTHGKEKKGTGVTHYCWGLSFETSVPGAFRIVFRPLDMHEQRLSQMMMVGSRSVSTLLEQHARMCQ